MYHYDAHAHLVKSFNLLTGNTLHDRKSMNFVIANHLACSAESNGQTHH